MQSEVLDRISSSTAFLQSRTAKAARGYLHPSLELALGILDELRGRGVTYEEIAGKFNISVESSRQIVRALKSGGIKIESVPQKVKRVKSGSYPRLVRLV